MFFFLICLSNVTTFTVVQSWMKWEGLVLISRSLTSVKSFSSKIKDCQRGWTLWSGLSSAIESWIIISSGTKCNLRIAFPDFGFVCDWQDFSWKAKSRKSTVFLYLTYFTSCKRSLQQHHRVRNSWWSFPHEHAFAWCQRKQYTPCREKHRAHLFVYISIFFHFLCH